VDTAITSTTLDYYGYETDIIMTYMNIDNWDDMKWSQT
jgi:hypothetical protein